MSVGVCVCVCRDVEVLYRNVQCYWQWWYCASLVLPRHSFYKRTAPVLHVQVKKKPCFFVHCSSSALPEKALSFLLANGWKEGWKTCDTSWLLSHRGVFFFVCVFVFLTTFHRYDIFFFSIFFFFFLAPAYAVHPLGVHGGRKKVFYYTNVDVHNI